MPVNLFDANYYRSVNPDLKDFNNDQAFQHLLQFGLNEGRSFSRVANLGVYQANNPDLAAAGLTSNRQLFEHLSNFGVAEGRTFSNTFNVNYYRSVNGDLGDAGFNNEQLFDHYMAFGIQEGRMAAPPSPSGAGIPVQPPPLPPLPPFGGGNPVQPPSPPLIPSPPTPGFGVGTDNDPAPPQPPSPPTPLIIPEPPIPVESTDPQIPIPAVGAPGVPPTIPEPMIPVESTNPQIPIPAAGAAGTPPAIDPLTGQSLSSNDDFENRVIQLTNEFRAQNGLPPLTPNPQLMVAAELHSGNMAQQDFYSHTGLDGSQPSTRALAAGYPSGFVGENIVPGYATPEEAMTSWINSPGHRENLLNPNYTEIGVGHVFLANDTGSVNYNHYWTQMFGG